jgi:hypothetical protein
MKDKQIFRFCEYCNAPYPDVSPYPEEQYQQGVIELGEFSHVALAQVKGNHTIDISGFYCNLDCLVKRLKKIRKWPKKK